MLANIQSPGFEPRKSPLKPPFCHLLFIRMAVNCMILLLFLSKIILASLRGGDHWTHCTILPTHHVYLPWHHATISMNRYPWIDYSYKFWIDTLLVLSINRYWAKNICHAILKNPTSGTLWSEPPRKSLKPIKIQTEEASQHSNPSSALITDLPVYSCTSCEDLTIKPIAKTVVPASYSILIGKAS